MNTFQSLTSATISDASPQRSNAYKRTLTDANRPAIELMNIENQEEFTRSHGSSNAPPAGENYFASHLNRSLCQVHGGGGQHMSEANQPLSATRYSQQREGEPEHVLVDEEGGILNAHQQMYMKLQMQRGRQLSQPTTRARQPHMLTESGVADSNLMGGQLFASGLQRSSLSSTTGRRLYGESGMSAIESILNQKEQELQHLNQIRMKNLEGIIESKLKMIDSIEKQQSAFNPSQISSNQNLGLYYPQSAPMQQTAHPSTSPSVRHNQQDLNRLSNHQKSSIHHITTFDEAEAASILKRYRERARKYKNQAKTLRAELSKERANSYALAQKCEQLKLSKRDKDRLSELLNEKWTAGSAENERRIQKEIEQIKVECKNVLRRQELEFESEKERYLQRLAEKEATIQDLQKRRYSRPQVMLNTAIDSSSKMLEVELHQLIEENQALSSRNEDLQLQLDNMRTSSMEHLENMERQLQQKYQNAAQTEQQLQELQEAFLEFRTERLQREAELKSQLERATYQSKDLLKEHQTALHQARLVAETERLNLKSEYEVKCEILGKENSLLTQERQKLKQAVADSQKHNDGNLKQLRNENQSLQHFIYQLQKKVDSLSSVTEDNEKLEKQIQSFKSQVHHLQVEKHGLLNQIHLYQKALVHTEAKMENNQLRQSQSVKHFTSNTQDAAIDVSPIRVNRDLTAKSNIGQKQHAISRLTENPYQDGFKNNEARVNQYEGEADFELSQTMLNNFNDTERNEQLVMSDPPYEPISTVQHFASNQHAIKIIVNEPMDERQLQEDESEDQLLNSSLPLQLESHQKRHQRSEVQAISPENDETNANIQTSVSPQRKSYDFEQKFLQANHSAQTVEKILDASGSIIKTDQVPTASRAKLNHGRVISSSNHHHPQNPLYTVSNPNNQLHAVMLSNSTGQFSVQGGGGTFGVQAGSELYGNAMVNFQKEYFSLKDESMQLKIQLHEAQTSLKHAREQIAELQLQFNHAADERKAYRNRVTELERECYDYQTKVKELSLQVAELTVSNHEMKSESKQSNRTIEEMQSQIRKLNDPIVVRMERDGLVQTHQKRIRDLECYIKQLEHSVSELQQQLASYAGDTQSNIDNGGRYANYGSQSNVNDSLAMNQRVGLGLAIAETYLHPQILTEVKAGDTFKARRESNQAPTYKNLLQLSPYATQSQKYEGGGNQGVSELTHTLNRSNSQTQILQVDTSIASTSCTSFKNKIASVKQQLFKKS